MGTDLRENIIASGAHAWLQRHNLHD